MKKHHKKAHQVKHKKHPIAAPAPAAAVVPGTLAGATHAGAVDRGTIGTSAATGGLQFSPADGEDYGHGFALETSASGFGAGDDDSPFNGFQTDFSDAELAVQGPTTYGRLQPLAPQSGDVSASVATPAAAPAELHTLHANGNNVTAHARAWWGTRSTADRAGLVLVLVVLVGGGFYFFRK